MKKKKNDQIVGAAQKEFMAKGFGGSSMENIALQAKVSKRTLYNYYSTKEVLFKQVISELLHGVNISQECRYSESESLDALFDEILDSKIELLTNEDFICASRILLGEQIKRNEIDKKFLTQLMGGYKPFKSWLHLCAFDGKIKESYSVISISNTVHALIEGVVFFPLVFGFKTKHSALEIKEIRRIVKENFISTFAANNNDSLDKGFDQQSAI